MYRIEVTNNGNDTATGISVMDFIPEPPFSAYQLVNNGFDTYELLPDYFSGTVNSLVQGASVSADIWITVTETGTDICNEGLVQLLSRTDTNLSNNAEESCVDIM